MSNNNIVRDMLTVLDRYEARTLTATQTETALERYAQALEGIGLKEIHRIRELTYQLVKSDFAIGEEEFINEKSVASAIFDLRSFLRTIPNAKAT